MDEKLMILPSHTYNKVRLVRVPDDYEMQEAYRKVTGIIAKVEEDNPDFEWEDIACELEESGFHQQDFYLGPMVD